MRAAYARIAEADRPEVWIALRAEDEALEDAAAVDGRVAAGEELPLAGTTLAVKDNIDVAGMPTTAGCPAFAYVPQASAPVVERLTAAGAVVLGKTNLDQFATGLVGTRSPYGAVRDVRRPDRVSGGSSSGSGGGGGARDRGHRAGHGHRGLGPGAGRVPRDHRHQADVRARAGARGRPRVPDARLRRRVHRRPGRCRAAMAHMTGPAPGDPTVRRGRRTPRSAPRPAAVGVPAGSQLADLSDDGRRAFADAVAQLEARGARVVEIDVAPLLETGRLLYGGAFVAERYAAVGTFISEHLDQADPVVGGIIMRARDLPAHQLVADIERRDQLRVVAEASLAGVDALLLPTAPFQPTIAEVKADPVGRERARRDVHDFCNLLDLCAVTVPAGEADGGRFGVSVLAPRVRGPRRGRRGAARDRRAGRRAGRRPGRRRARRVRGPSQRPAAERAAHGRRRAAAGHGAHRAAVPHAPDRRRAAQAGRRARAGGRRRARGGTVERAAAGLAHLLVGLPAPLALGRVRLADGRERVGFLCEAAALDGAEDITRFGSWPAWQAGVPVAGA